jgi:coenzyme F420-reducing hydrogenase delta subunit
MIMSAEAEKPFTPKILVFSSEKISDPAIDLAGLLKKHYPPTVYNISVPCTSGVKPRWIIHALKSGIDGVFVASDGTDCAYRSDCSNVTSQAIKDTQKILEKEGINVARVKMAAICSVCADPFVNHMKAFLDALKAMGSVKNELKN